MRRLRAGVAGEEERDGLASVDGGAEADADADAEVEAAAAVRREGRGTAFRTAGGFRRGFFLVAAAE